jgi:glyoxylate reductase
VKRPVVAVSFPLPLRALELLREAAEVRGPARWRGSLPEAEGLLTHLGERVDADLLAQAPRLRVVANAVVGHDNVDLEACRSRGVAVTNTPGVLTQAVAELTWALILMAVRRLSHAERSLRRGEFSGWRFNGFLGGDLRGRTLGIVGLGRIGNEVARRAPAFGMQVIHSGGSPAAGVDSAPRELHRLLAEADVVSLHLPLTPATHHLLDDAALGRMKPGGVLINTARGALVHEAALVGRLTDGPLAAAGLDVYEHEPRVHPALLQLENVVLLPHVGSATRETREEMALLAARNVLAVLSGEAPLTPVTEDEARPAG